MDDALHSHQIPSITPSLVAFLPSFHQIMKFNILCHLFENGDTMKRLLTVLVTAAMLAGCAGTSTMKINDDPVVKLRNDIDAVLADSIFIPSRAAVKIVSLKTGEVLYDQNSKMLVRPASNMKLLTTSTAIAQLGKDFKFKTAIFINDSISEGILQGDLYVKGWGDPDLVTSDLDSMASQLYGLGIRGIKGNLVADLSYFDSLYWGDGWSWDDESASYSAFISALTLNDNCVGVTVAPGDSAGKALRVTFDPQTDYVSLRNDGITVADTARKRVNIDRLFMERLNTITVAGEMTTDKPPVTDWITVWKPELYALQVLRERLQWIGIAVKGVPTVGVLPPTARELAARYRGLDSVIININKISDNLSAEHVLKTLGAVKYGMPGSARQGIHAVRAFLTTLGVDTLKYRQSDGSGLSTYNLITAEMMVQLLSGMAANPEWFPLFYASLPIAGVDGSISGRMRKTPAEGNLRAKTGHISGVSSLSGYVTSADGELIAFSMMMQNFITPTRPFHRVQEAIGNLLATFSRTKKIVADK
jgi:D-alanyl-D-alanine carboxypeptidase/D-alanyl-D-alanine-endopeptidase (penicillin-binding protein 4)